MKEFESYDYLKVTVKEEQLSEYLDGYENFGWKLDPNMPVESNGGKAVLHFKRSRAILNKTELIRLQRHYEACMREREKLEESKASTSTMAAISCGVIGGVRKGTCAAVKTELQDEPESVILRMQYSGFFAWREENEHNANTGTDRQGNRDLSKKWCEAIRSVWIFCNRDSHTDK